MGLQFNASQKDVLVSIETGTHTTNWSGIWASAQAGNFSYQKIGDTVWLYLPSIQSTSDTASFISLDTLLPSSIRPATDERCGLIVQDSSGKSNGEAVILSTGDINIYRGVNESSFSGSGTEGLVKSTLFYNLK